MKKILKFYSPTCGPCKVMGKTLSSLEGVDIEEIDITDDANESLLEKWNIRTIPTVIVLDENDELVKEFKGVVSMDKINEALNDTEI